MTGHGKVQALEEKPMDLKKLEQKVRGELFDNNQRDFTCSNDFQTGYDRALNLVLRWISED